LGEEIHKGGIKGATPRRTRRKQRGFPRLLGVHTINKGTRKEETRGKKRGGKFCPGKRRSKRRGRIKKIKQKRRKKNMDRRERRAVGSLASGNPVQKGKRKSTSKTHQKCPLHVQRHGPGVENDHPYGRRDIICLPGE